MADAPPMTDAAIAAKVREIAARRGESVRNVLSQLDPPPADQPEASQAATQQNNRAPSADEKYAPLPPGKRAIDDARRMGIVGMGASGIGDLATNPMHMEGFGGGR